MSSQYKQEARNWAKSWAGYSVRVSNYTGYSMVEVSNGDRKINAWFDESGQETAKTGDVGFTDETVKELKEWIDAQTTNLYGRNVSGKWLIYFAQQLGW
jgi:hypothetical protein